jgi:hypothetical protein
MNFPCSHWQFSCDFSYPNTWHTQIHDIPWYMTYPNTWHTQIHDIPKNMTAPFPFYIFTVELKWRSLITAFLDQPCVYHGKLFISTFPPHKMMPMFFILGSICLSLSDMEKHDRSISFLHFYSLHYQEKFSLQAVSLQSTF